MMFRMFIALIAVVAIAMSTHAQDTREEKEFRVTWTDPMEDYEGTLRLKGLDAITRVQVSYTYPGGGHGEVVATLADEDAADGNTYRFVIPADVLPQLGTLKYTLNVSYGTDNTYTTDGVVPLAYVEDLEITANPPEILWFELGDESATVRYTACCNILGASVIAKRIPVNPMESGEGLPAKLYSDFIWLEPDALSASTAGLYFEFGFNPKDFASSEKKTPVIYEYHWRKKNWNPVLSFDVVDGDTLDFPATEGGVYVLAWE
ncbi:MAG: hypothetical protein VCD00_10955 [Candidatus Hydrogenedentota bacterium]